MSMLKRWVPASFIAVAMALALAGGAVLAFGGGNDSKRSDVFERAAEILGIAPSELQAAHDQAQREARDAEITQIVDTLLEREIIDQAEADSFNVWIASRPDSADGPLFDQLTSSITRSPRIGVPSLGMHRMPLPVDRDLDDRIAEILGIDPQELRDALADGRSQIERLDRIARIHAIVDQMLTDEKITVDEAAELHSWIDDIPEWLLNLDIPSRILPGLGSFGGELGSFGGLDWLKRIPFGDGEHFGEGKREFRFEFNGPEGSFRFGPRGHDFSFGNEEGLENFFERFEDLEHLEEFENFDGLFELFGHHDFLEDMFERQFDPNTSTPSA
jgi:hypothetical protein